MIVHLHRHRVLTALHLARLEFGSYSAARSRLALLHARGVLARFRRDVWPGTQPWRYTLGHVGALVHAAATGAPFPRPNAITDTVLRLAHSTHTEHRLGINTFFTTLHGHARNNPGCALQQWATETEAAELTGGILRPDGHGTYNGQGRTLTFFYDHDTGTETIDTVLDKIATYGDLATAGLTHPVLIDLPGTRREHHLHTAIARRWPTGAPAPVATLPADQLAPTGRAITPATPSPLDVLWLPAGHIRRRALTHLAPRADGARADGAPGAGRARPHRSAAPTPTPTPERPDTDRRDSDRPDDTRPDAPAGHRVTVERVDTEVLAPAQHVAAVAALAALIHAWHHDTDTRPGTAPAPGTGTGTGRRDEAT